MVIQVIGQSGAGKTGLSIELARRLGGIHINADKVRADLSKDLGFGMLDRIENARRLGALARLLDDQDRIVVVDFICPTEETRKAFGSPACLVWVARDYRGRFADTNRLWEDPTEFDIKIQEGLSIDEEVHLVISWIRNTKSQIISAPGE